MITAIIGRNASGKTQYVEQMRRRLSSDTIRYIAFRDTYGPAVDSQYYLQLRWNQHDIDPEMPTVREALSRSKGSADAMPLLKSFGLEGSLDKHIITLSSGELRKFQLVKTLLHNPRTLILDNPFIGLDAETRQQLRDLLLRIATEQQIDLFLVLAKSDDIPGYVERIIDMDHQGRELPLQEYLNTRAPFPTRVLSEEQEQEILGLPHAAHSLQEDEIIRMTDVSIRYGERTILKDLNWTVRCGERWALSGQNGAGKSTLLSLVCADNPQGYACDIRLFGHQRGEQGVSIWDIKRRIGYVSPELARSYHRDIASLRIVASGLKDTVGLYVQTNTEEKEQCLWWMRIFGIEHLADRSFMTLSSGEQRLVLLARAFVKDPDLLILDEPLHGLDNINRQLVKDVIETFCQRRNKTFIMVTHYQEELPPCIDHSLVLLKHNG